ncbi:hypothetical protein ACFQU7_19735 [Pseudoroseomonas wenyumeiae]
MTRTITGLFNTRGAAESVIHHLMSHDSIDRSHITLHGPDKADDGYEHDGFWTSMLHLFIPDSARHAYAEAIRRGSYLVAVELPEDKVDHVLSVFTSHGAVDLDSLLARWRAEGWKDYVPPAAGTGAPGGMASSPGAGQPRSGQREPDVGDGRARSYIADTTPR